MLLHQGSKLPVPFSLEINQPVYLCRDIRSSTFESFNQIDLFCFDAFGKEGFFFDSNLLL